VPSQHHPADGHAPRSTLRAAQARATRRAIVDAAARLFTERGFGATTIDAIAEAAGVSRKTVFTSVGGKTEALKLAIDWAIAGDDEPVPILERPQRIRGMRAIAQALADRGALKPGLTPSEAADILWLLIDPSVYHRLVIEQRWTPGRYQDWLADALISLLIPASYQPKA
jgi:AcrR family transcriptional regulator